MTAMNELVRFLGRHPPFDALPEEELAAAADAAELVDFESGDEILDAFASPAQELYVVLFGEVEIWNSSAAGVGEPDEVLTAGGLFGFSALLSGAAVGPMARALGPVRVARIPAAQVTPAFSSAAGAQFLAQHIGSTANRPSERSAYGVVDQLIVSTPVTLSESATVHEAAAAMTAAGSRYAVVGSAATGYGLLTDARLRERILGAGLPAETPVSAATIDPAPSVSTGTLAAQALLEITDRNLDCLLVLDRTGALRGLVSREDFLVSPSTAGIALREQISRTGSAAELIVLARRVPMLLADLMRRGRSAGEVTTINATVIDAITRRVLALVLADRPGLDAGEFSWLAMGSNGRREPVLSSDIDAAVVFAETVHTEEAMTAYRSAFDEVTALLGRCGLAIDLHGAVPGRLLFARTRSEWRAAARQWRDAPLEHNGMMMTSLLLDARPIQGDPGAPVMAEVFGDMRSHPGTLRLLLAESLVHRARFRSMRDVLVRRNGTFDLKAHALRPVVDIARWAALAVGSPALSTAERLAAAAGSPMFPADQADTLIEVFEVLQKTRLRYQMTQVQRGEEPSDVLVMHQLSPLDRSLIEQAIREIAAVQRRMTNVAQVTDPADW
jgi:CBS domain-containing protein